MHKTEDGPQRASFTVYLKRMISRYLPYAKRAPVQRSPTPV